MVSGAPSAAPLDFGPFRIDLSSREVRRNGERLVLTPKAFDILVALVSAGGRIVTRQELFEGVWAGISVDENNLNQQIRILRKALGPEWAAAIETVPRVGYRAVLPHGGAGTRRSRWIRLTIGRAIAAGLVVVLLAVSAASVLVESGSERVPAPSSIAVVPFFDNGGGEDAYLGFAIAEALTAALGSTRGLRARPVAAGTTLLDEPLEAVAAGKRLRVEAVVSGSVRRSGGRIRVTARLTRVEDGAVMWWGTFDRPVSELFGLPGDVYRSLAAAMRLQEPEIALRRTRQPASAEAYEEYAKGRYLWNRRDFESMQKSVDHFRRAIALDPNYAAAWAGLGSALGFLERPEADEATSKALALDDALAEARANRAVGYLLGRFDFALAKREFERAIRSDPYCATAHHWFAFYWAAVGDLDRALASVDQARRLEPSSLIIQTDVAQILYYARRYEEARAQVEGVIALDPTFAQAHRVHSAILIALGRYDEAVSAIQESVRIDGWTDDPRVAYALARAGRHAEAREVVERVVAAPHPNAPYFLAEAWTALGDHHRALLWLERAYAARRVDVALIKVEPKLDPLRDEPRFDELLARLGL